jgi:parvulin-like peptidyl-prolyl isomerase
MSMTTPMASSSNTVGSRRPLVRRPIMHPRFRIVRVAAGALAVVVAFGAGYALQARRQPDSPLVAVVDGEPITSEEVDVRLSDILPFASYHGRIEGTRLLSLRRAALDESILDELIYRDAVAHGRIPSRSAVDAAVTEVVSRFPTRGAYLRALADSGLTDADVRARHERAILIREAREAHERLVVSDADVAAYYREHAGKFERPEQRHVVEVLFRIDPADPASADRARLRARDLAARVRRGEDLGRLARALSEDEYRVKDGDMGFVHRGRLAREFEAAVFAAAPRRVTVARGFLGYQVFTVLEEAPRTQLTLDQARPVIRERLERTRRAAAVSAWHASLRAAARIDILDTALKNAAPADLALPADWRMPAAAGPVWGGQ